MTARMLTAFAAAAVVAAACGGSDDDGAGDTAVPVVTDAAVETDPPATEPLATEPLATEPLATEPPPTESAATEPPPPTEPPARTFEDVGHPVERLVDAGPAYWAVGSLTKIDVASGQILAEFDWRAAFDEACQCVSGRLGSATATPEGEEPSVLYVVAGGDDGAQWLAMIEPSGATEPPLTATRLDAPDGGVVVVDDRVVVGGMISDGGTKTIRVDSYLGADLAAGNDAAPIATATADGFGAGAQLRRDSSGRAVITEGKSTTTHRLSDDAMSFSRSEIVPPGSAGDLSTRTSPMAGSRGGSWYDTKQGLEVTVAGAAPVLFPELKPEGFGNTIEFSDGGAHVLTPNFPETTHFYTFIGIDAVPGSLTKVEIAELPAPFVVLPDGTAYVGAQCIPAGGTDALESGVSFGSGIVTGGGYAALTTEGGIRHVSGCPAVDVPPTP